MQVVARIVGFLRAAPFWIRLRVIASAVLAAIAVLMFALGQTVVGVIAAILYIGDLAIIGPLMRLRLARRQARK